MHVFNIFLMHQIEDIHYEKPYISCMFDMSLKGAMIDDCR
jgi:hypothetical protein